MLAHATRSQARSRMARLIILALAFSAIPLLPGSPVEPAAAVTGTTTRVSVSSAGAEANASSNYAEISADGQFVAFVSAATNLVTDDTNAVADVFLHDRVAVSSLVEQAAGAELQSREKPN